MNTEKPTILIVEDDLALRGALRDKLVLSGFTVLEAGDGEAGLALALREKPALMLLDIVMPKIDGLSVLEKLRQEEEGKKLPVIMLTNLSDAENVAQALDHEVFDYLVKSNIKLEEVVSVVKKKLGLSAA